MAFAVVKDAGSISSPDKRVALEHMQVQAG